MKLNPLIKILSVRKEKRSEIHGAWISRLLAPHFVAPEYRKIIREKRGLSEPKASSAAPDYLRNAGIKPQLGVFSFGYFTLDKQRKVTRLEAKSNLN